MSTTLVCWKCGSSLAAVLLPLRRLEECPGCHAELHVCRLCEWYEPHVAKSCREPIADEVKNKERANFCDYFKPRPGAYQARDVGAVTAARSGLDALFGAGPNAAPPPAKDAAVEAERARSELEKLFGPKR
jgi:hypothetical protein